MDLLGICYTEGSSSPTIPPETINKPTLSEVEQHFGGHRTLYLLVTDYHPRASGFIGRRLRI